MYKRVMMMDVQITDGLMGREVSDPISYDRPRGGGGGGRGERPGRRRREGPGGPPPGEFI